MLFPANQVMKYFHVFISLLMAVILFGCHPCNDLTPSHPRHHFGLSGAVFLAMQVIGRMANSMDIVRNLHSVHFCFLSSFNDNCDYLSKPRLVRTC